NGTRFHLLLGRSDWAACTPVEPRVSDPNRPTLTLAMSWAATSVENNTSGLEWDAANFEVTLKPRLFQFQSAASHRLTLSQRRSDPVCPCPSGAAQHRTGRASGLGWAIRGINSALFRRARPPARPSGRRATVSFPLTRRLPPISPRCAQRRRWYPCL